MNETELLEVALGFGDDLTVVVVVLHGRGALPCSVLPTVRYRNALLTFVVTHTDQFRWTNTDAA